MLRLLRKAKGKVMPLQNPLADNKLAPDPMILQVSKTSVAAPAVHSFWTTASPMCEPRLGRSADLVSPRGISVQPLH